MSKYIFDFLYTNILLSCLSRRNALRLPKHILLMWYIWSFFVLERKNIAVIGKNISQRYLLLKSGKFFARITCQRHKFCLFSTFHTSFRQLPQPFFTSRSSPVVLHPPFFISCSSSAVLHQPFFTSRSSPAIFDQPFFISRYSRYRQSGKHLRKHHESQKL